MLVKMNIMGFPQITESARVLAELTSKRDAKRVKDETWATRREQLGAEASDLLREIDLLIDEPGPAVIEWLDGCIGGHLPLSDLARPE